MIQAPRASSRIARKSRSRKEIRPPGEGLEGNLMTRYAVALAAVLAMTASGWAAEGGDSTAAPSDEQQATNVALKLHGYLRVRPEYFHDLNLDSSEAPPSYTARRTDPAFVAQRLRLDPEIQANEELSVMAQMDLLDGIWGYNNPSVQTDSGGVAFDANPLTSSSPTVVPVVRRAWAEWKSPLGLVRFGRMSAKWGMGMWLNDGNEYNVDRGDRNPDWGDKYFGDTFDRVMWKLQVGSLAFAPFYDKIVEGPAANNGPSDPQTTASGSPVLLQDGDVDEYGFASLYDVSDRARVGLYAVYRAQPVPTRANLYTADLYGTWDLEFVNLEAEGVVNSGSLYAPDNLPGGNHKVDVASGGAVGRGVVPWGDASFTVEAGYASGPDSDEYDPNPNAIVGSPLGTHRKGFAMNADHNVGLLLFEQSRYSLATSAQQAAQGGFKYQGPQLPIGGSDVNGNPAVYNAVYARIMPKYTLGDFLEAKCQVLWAMAPVKYRDPSTGATADQYGTEIDVGLGSPSTNTLQLGVQAGYFLPGNIFKKPDGSNASNATAVEGRLTVIF